ncbi:MAG: hypothetical protein KA314_17565 [Chloroflexi bacterium]|nr:hypothetical protein [Chloroflexota bacterium]MBP8057641.1 hypothetical protein [Chloroflexota bacterium]
MSVEEFRTIGLIMAAIVIGGLVLVGILFLIALRQVRQLNIPEDAGFSETLHYTPLVVAVMIDVLDLSLDFLAAPVAWVLLDRLGLKALRGVSVLEAFIPGTQFIPTMTLAWILVRLFNIR